MNINFHWMFNYGNPSVDSLKHYSKILDENGYESMLLVYDPKHPDYLIPVANIINKDQKIKYMFAIRTYSISPEFLSMMCESFNRIDPNRIVLNICAGDKPQMDHETEIDGLVDLDILKNNVYERILYTRKWTKKFIKLKIMEKLPFLVFSGKSDYTLETAKLYGDCTLFMYNTFKEDPKRLKVTPRTMVSAAIIIADNEESINKILESSTVDTAKFWTISGNTEQVKNELIKLEKMGVTDILVSNPFKLQSNIEIHNFVKSFSTK